jgi:hypothetical protein
VLFEIRKILSLPSSLQLVVLSPLSLLLHPKRMLTIKTIRRLGIRIRSSNTTAKRSKKSLGE